MKIILLSTSNAVGFEMERKEEQEEEELSPPTLL
jgi:hypothetical protein